MKTYHESMQKKHIDLLIQFGLSAGQIAERLGVSPAVVSRIRNGHRNNLMLGKNAQLRQLTIEYLSEKRDEMEKEAEFLKARIIYAEDLLIALQRNVI